MGRLGYAKCIYDEFYPCEFGCDKKDCTYYGEEEEYEDEREAEYYEREDGEDE